MFVETVIALRLLFIYDSVFHCSLDTVWCVNFKLLIASLCFVPNSYVSDAGTNGLDSGPAMRKNACTKKFKSSVSRYLGSSLNFKDKLSCR